MLGVDVGRLRLRVILGTAAVRDPELAEAIASAHGDRVVASVDSRSGRVAAEGWTQGTDLATTDVIGHLARTHSS